MLAVVVRQDGKLLNNQATLYTASFICTVNCEHTFLTNTIKYRMCCFSIVRHKIRLEFRKRKPSADQKHCRAREHKERRRVGNWLAMISCIWAKTEIKESKNGGYNHVSTPSLLPPFLLHTSPIPLFQLPPSSEWSSVDYTLYLPLLSHSFAASLRSWLARTHTHSQYSGIHT